MEREIEELLQQLRFIVNTYQQDEKDIKCISKMIEKKMKQDSKENKTTNK